MRTLHYIIGLFLGGIFFLGFKVYNSYQPPTGRTGAPGETSCRSCHSGGTATGSIQIQLLRGSTPVTEYVPGETYTVQVQITGTNLPSSPGYGFSMTALDPGNQIAGTFSGTGVSLQTASGKQYVGHSGVSTTGSWTFSWQAPATNVGNVKFYVGYNIVNRNGGTSGDSPFVSSYELQAASSTSLAKVSSMGFVWDAVTKRLFMHDRGRSLWVYTLAGQLVWHVSHPDREISLPSLPEGIYLIRWESQNQKTLEGKIWY
ncbi:MAG: choice-of-anchor V domain-containing protein [Bacteroidia bacterium]